MQDGGALVHISHLFIPLLVDVLHSLICVNLNQSTVMLTTEKGLRKCALLQF